MGYQLGIDLGTTFTAAALCRNGDASIFPLGTNSAVIPSVVLVREDGTFLTGDAAARRAISEPERIVREFKRRVGDPTPIIVAGSPLSAAALTARLLRSVLEQVESREGGPHEQLAISHPANWGQYKIDLLIQTVSLAGLDPGSVQLISEPEAAAICYAMQERAEPGEVYAVYDLGGGTFDAAVLRRTEGGFEILGKPEGIERLGGVDFDAAVVAHVTASLDGALNDLDIDQPGVLSAVSRLRRECVAAKEALSVDTDAAIPVLLPSYQGEVRITRREFEERIRPPLLDSIEAMRRALHSAGVEPAQVSRVLLVGGSSRVPLVGQLVSSELGRPIAVDTHPKHAVALGCAWAAAGALAGRSAAAGRSPASPDGQPAAAAALHGIGPASDANLAPPGGPAAPLPAPPVPLASSVGTPAPPGWDVQHQVAPAAPSPHGPATTFPPAAESPLHSTPSPFAATARHAELPEHEATVAAAATPDLVAPPAGELTTVATGTGPHTAWPPPGPSWLDAVPDATPPPGSGWPATGHGFAGATSPPGSGWVPGLADGGSTPGVGASPHGTAPQEPTRLLDSGPRGAADLHTQQTQVVQGYRAHESSELANRSHRWEGPPTPRRSRVSAGLVAAVVGLLVLLGGAAAYAITAGGDDDGDGGGSAQVETDLTAPGDEPADESPTSHETGEAPDDSLAGYETTGSTPATTGDVTGTSAGTTGSTGATAPTATNTSTTGTSTASITTSTTAATTSTTTSTTAATSQPIEITAAPNAYSIQQDEFAFDYHTNDVCGDGKFTVRKKSTNELIGSWNGNGGCNGPRHGGNPQAVHPTFGGFDLEPGTTYVVAITVVGTASDGTRTAGTGSDSATLEVTTAA